MPRLQISQFGALRAVTDHEQMKAFWYVVIQIFKSTKKQPGIFFFGQPANIKQESSRVGNLERGPGGCGIIRDGAKSDRVYPKSDRPDIIHAPAAQDRPQPLGRDQRSRESGIKVANVAAREIHHGFARSVSKKLGRAPNVSLRKVRMVKAHHRKS